MTSVQPTSNGG